MPDDMLEDAITVAKKALEEHDFEEEGVEVSFVIIFFGSTHRFANLFLDRLNCQETHGRLVGTLLARIPRKVFRLPRRPREKPLRLLPI